MSRPLLPVPWVIALAIFLIAMGLAHLGAVIRYSVPNAEDFALSIAPRLFGVTASVVDLLSFMDSRYTTNLLQGINILTIGQYRLFWVMPALTLSALWLSMAFFLGSLFSPKGRLQVPLAAAVLTVAFYAIAPSFGFSLIYMSSTFTYMWPFVLWFLWTGCLLRSFASGGLRHVAFTALGLVCLLLSYGCSELFILLNPMTLGMIAMVAPGGVRRHLPDLAPYALVSLAALLFILNCPSNKFVEERIIGDLADRYPGTNFALHGLGMFLKTLLRAFLSPLTLLSVVVFSHLLPMSSVRDTVSRPANGRVLVAIFVMWQVMAYIVALGYYLPLGSVYEYPGRALNVVMLVSLTGIMVAAAISGPRMFIPRRLNRPGAASAAILVMLILGCVVFPGANYRMIRNEFLDGTLPLNQQRHLQFYRDAEMAVFEGKRPSIVRFAMPDTIPFSVFPERDLLPNRENEDWNIAYEMYFGVDEVRMQGDTVFKR